MLCKVFSAVCPELHYTSTHLLSELQREQVETEAISSYTDSTSGNSSNNSNNHTNTEMKRFRIGFLSTNFFDHSIGRILVELFIHLQHQIIKQDNQKYALDVYVYGIDRRIPSDTTLNITNNIGNNIHSHIHDDVITYTLKHHLKENFLQIPENITSIRRVLTSAELDFLVFADVGMDFMTYQLAFSRFAQYQVS